MMRKETKAIATTLELKLAPGVAAGTFSGYGSVFGNVDSYGDVVAKGAFRDTLREWKTKGKLPPMLLQHGGGFFGGAAGDLVPIGVWDEMKEDDHGLLVSGHLIAMETERAKQVYAAMQEGALDGLSIGFRVKQAKLGTKPEEPVRTLQKIDLAEVSVVTFPANGAATVDAVKSVDDWTERELEGLLRDAGFSRRDAQIVIAKGFRALRDSAPEMGRLLSPDEKQAYLRQLGSV